MAVIGAYCWLAAAITAALGLIAHGNARIMVFGCAIGLAVSGTLMFLLRLWGAGKSLDVVDDAVVESFADVEIDTIGNDNDDAPNGS